MKFLGLRADLHCDLMDSCLPSLATGSLCSETVRGSCCLPRVSMSELSMSSAPGAGLESWFCPSCTWSEAGPPPKPNLSPSKPQVFTTEQPQGYEQKFC